MNTYVNSSPAPILVAACGNAWAGDDAWGPLVAAQLHLLHLPDVEVLDLGTRPAALLDALPNRTALALVDAVHCPALPGGQPLELDWFDPQRPPLVHDDALSTHGLGLADQLELARRLDILPPHVRLFAVTVGQTLLHGLPAAEVGSQVAPMAQRIAHWCEALRQHTPHALIDC